MNFSIDLENENVFKRIFIGVLAGLLVFAVLSILTAILPPIILLCAIFAPETFNEPEEQEKIPLND